MAEMWLHALALEVSALMPLDTQAAISRRALAA